MGQRAEQENETGILTVIGGSVCLEQGMPTESGIYRFFPAVGITETGVFVVSGFDLGDRLFSTFGTYDIVPIGNGKWSVENTELILGTIVDLDIENQRLDTSQNCEVGDGYQRTPQSNVGVNHNPGAGQ